jgi:hypothetical protein
MIPLPRPYGRSSHRLSKSTQAQIWAVPLNGANTNTLTQHNHQLIPQLQAIPQQRTHSYRPTPCSIPSTAATAPGKPTTPVSTPNDATVTSVSSHTHSQTIIQSLLEAQILFSLPFSVGPIRTSGLTPLACPPLVPQTLLLLLKPVHWLVDIVINGHMALRAEHESLMSVRRQAYQFR